VGTSLATWTQDDDLNVETSLPKEKELYFPFQYDKYQLRTLGLLGSKASIIEGPPGTGKSETISNILCHLAATHHRVLFVSQKAQALKVVKDKLKKLGVKYLFGYLPNPGSSQLGEEDEVDGIAPQLTGLGSHIDRLMQRTVDTPQSAIEQTVEKKEKLVAQLNRTIYLQRRYYSLHQELLRLTGFDLAITDISRFAKRFSESAWQEITNTLVEIALLEDGTEGYEACDEKREFDHVFLDFEWDAKIVTDAIGAIKDDIARTGYDRRSRVFRFH